MMDFGLPGATTLVAGLLVVLGAGVVRGFAGFGFSALTVAGFSVFRSPAEVVPIAILLEVLASVTLIRSATGDADRRWLGWLVAFNALCIPMGILLLAWLPETQLRLVIGTALLLTATMLRLFEGHTVAPGAAMRATTGIASGLIQGVAASGGVAAALLMTAARLPATKLRATMIVYLLFAGPYTLLCAALVTGGTEVGKGLLGTRTLIEAALFAPVMVLGIWFGKRAFAGADPLRFRRFVLHLLIVMSALGVGRALFDLLR